MGFKCSIEQKSDPCELKNLNPRKIKVLTAPKSLGNPNEKDQLGQDTRPDWAAFPDMSGSGVKKYPKILPLVFSGLQKIRTLFRTLSGHVRAWG